MCEHYKDTYIKICNKERERSEICTQARINMSDTQEVMENMEISNSNQRQKETHQRVELAWNDYELEERIRNKKILKEKKMEWVDSNVIC